MSSLLQTLSLTFVSCQNACKVDLMNNMLCLPSVQLSTFLSVNYSFYLISLSYFQSLMKTEIDTDLVENTNKAKISCYNICYNCHFNGELTVCLQTLSLVQGHSLCLELLGLKTVSRSFFGMSPSQRFGKNGTFRS